MSSFFIAASAFALSQIVLSLSLLLREPRGRSVQEWLLACLLISAAAYLLYPVLNEHWLEPARKVMEGFLPGLFWLLCCSLFDDRFQLRADKLALVGATVLIPLLGRVLASNGVIIPNWLFYTVPQGLEFVLLALALLAVVQHWKVDLVEARRRLRLWFCAMTGGYIFVLIAMREILFPESQWLVLWQYVPVGLVCLAINMLLLQYKPGLISPLSDQLGAQPEQPKIAAVEDVDVPKAIIAQLDALMNQQHLYRQMGLTIGQLADQLALPEYRLRKMINAGLGYRNFNDYLNSFRIEEAGQKLADPALAEQAVLNIALDVGFRSLSSFNKAFRDAYGLTPSDYRRRQIKSTV